MSDAPQGGPHDQAFEPAGTPHGGDHLGHPGEAVGRAAEWRSGPVDRRGIAAKSDPSGGAFYPARALIPRVDSQPDQLELCSSESCGSATVNDLRYRWRMRDSDVRGAVRDCLRAKYASDPSTRIVEEMGVWSGAVRVDIAVINGELLGYELKSNCDTLERLPRQVEIYGKVFDRMTLVVGDRHADKALRVVPPWWGCMVATMLGDEVGLRWKRKPRQNPDQDPAIFVQMLWKEEAVSILERYGLAKGWRSKRSSEIADRLLSEIPFNKLANDIRAALKVREKLGQLIAREFDVPVDAIAHPTSRTSR